jgi:hypothetical protein
MPKVCSGLVLTAVLSAAVSPGPGSHAQVAPLPPIALTRIAALPGQTPAGMSRYLDHPAVQAGGHVFALRMPDRRLVRLEVRGGTLTAVEVPLPASVYVPLAIAVDQGGRLLVLDPSVRRVFRFTPAGTGLRDAGSFPVEDGADGICAMGGRIYVYRPGAEHPVSVYSDAGAPVATFGQQFGGGSARRREALSQGRIFCSVAERQVIVATNLSGDLRSYGESGRLLWSRRLTGVQALPVLDAGEGRISMVTPRDGYHMLLSVTSIRPGSLLVQYGFRLPGQGSANRRVESRSIAAGSGAELGRQDDLPGWLTGLGGDRALSLDQATGAATVWRVAGPRRQPR